MTVDNLKKTRDILERLKDPSGEIKLDTEEYTDEQVKSKIGKILNELNKIIDNHTDK